MDRQRLTEFYKGKKVLVTGHTGFKGSWLTMLLLDLGAEVYGYSLKPDTDPALYDILGIDPLVHSTIGDIRDMEKLEAAYTAAAPDVVLHLAAQPIVRESYKDPRYTYETNVMGTVNLLECLRRHPGAVSFLNVTTDKVYENNEDGHAFREDEKLDGYDPYSNSKSCSELVTHSYAKSFFMSDGSPAISTARAGNVVGGGDFARDRIIPDCVRATVAGEPIAVRNPNSVRPYQHVLEPVCAYLMIAMMQASDRSIAGSYNIGPDVTDCINTGTVADMFVKYWGGNASWKNVSEADAPHEANFLKLDHGKISGVLGWNPAMHADRTIEMTAGWYRAWSEGMDMKEYTARQIREYADEAE